ncbi:hypothetical protein B0H16DRAFT_1582734 [Mycena metata]|uniref:Uncharacterized protein n=1 Tax=Mycena metata TaxID=1033252 RepID=A0AAD7MTY4_9AGAR|nr:hypothetical protein B0H16DRAFT_1582687 [Mycena metata]KAJ7731863.1 hypothetical protein B0H16DRAFT_1582734 [Mycena metata]
MQFNILFLTIILSAGLAAAITLPEALEAETSQCGAIGTLCFLTGFNCCSGSCCCGVGTGNGDCSPTPCSIFQEEGTEPGFCG